jgi:glycosyltransferase involved in cell wall biosynthesis
VKNVEGLLQAFSQSVQNIPDLSLVIAGDGEPGYVGSLKRLAEKLGLSAHVLWTGYVEGNQKRDLLAAASVFVLPSYSENFGIAAAEALMAGVPCILGEGVAIANDVEAAQAGFVTSTDSKDIAHALVKIFEDNGQLDQMGIGAREFALENYSLAKMGKDLVALYESILEPKREA